MGAVFAVPLAKVDAPDELPGVKVALVPGQGVPLRELEADPEVTLMVGAEREGLPQAVIDQSDHTVQIPIRSNSLNAAMAATIALYELTLRMDSR